MLSCGPKTTTRAMPMPATPRNKPLSKSVLRRLTGEALSIKVSRDRSVDCLAVKTEPSNTRKDMPVPARCRRFGGVARTRSSGNVSAATG